MRTKPKDSSFLPPRWILWASHRSTTTHECRRIH